MKSNDTIQQIADRIIASLNYSLYQDNLKEIELFNSEKTKDTMILHFQSYVTVDMIKEISDEIGYNINCIFNNTKDITLYVPLQKVILR